MVNPAKCCKVDGTKRAEIYEQYEKLTRGKHHD